ncbi:MAG: hypothetical protein QME94_00555 [Anaerolineae bacterium]|nr:hypothetical protein [Anaerolineae bacterium]
MSQARSSRGGRTLGAAPAAAADGTAPAPQTAEMDPLYRLALADMQQGRWQEADGALLALERQYPSSPAVRLARESLALRLSAEQTWQAAAADNAATLLRTRAIWALLLANLLVYGTLAVIHLLAGTRH